MSLFLFHHKFFFILPFPFLGRIGFFLLLFFLRLAGTALWFVLFLSQEIDLFLFCFFFDHRVLLLFFGFLSRVTRKRSRFGRLIGSASSNSSSRWLICSTLIGRRTRLIGSTLSSRKRWLIRSQLSGRCRI